MLSDELDRLLAPISPESPSGDNLEYDPAFMALEQAARGKAEQRMGDAVVAGEGPNWREVRQAAAELLTRTKDLRVAVFLARAWIWTAGLPGLGDGLELLRGLLEAHWDTLHPQLDPDDDNDPTLRLNTLASLADPDATLNALREAPLVDARGLGRFSLKDVQRSAGGTATSGDERTGPDPGTIDAAFATCDVEALAATTAAAERALASLEAIRQILMDRTGSGTTLAELTKLVRAAHHVLAERLERRSGAATSAHPAEPATEAAMEAPRLAPSPARVGAIGSRDDAVRTLEQLCEYFEHNEPSSPVPLLLRRAKRLVSKSFLDIIRDLAPDALAQVESIRGVDTQEE